MRNILNLFRADKYGICFYAILLFLLFLSCNSSQPTNDTDLLSDNDNDIIMSDTDEDSLFTDNDNTLTDEDSEPDEDPIVYPPQKCKEMEEGDPDSVLCFGPRAIREVWGPRKCTLPTEVGINVELFTGYVTAPGSASSDADINDNFIFFVYAVRDIIGNVYGCNRHTADLYAILELTNIRYDIDQFSVDKNYIVFNVYDKDSEYGKKNTIYLGDLDTNDFYPIFQSDSYKTHFSLHWPYLTTTDIGTNKLTIFNLETGSSSELDTPRGKDSHSDGKTAIIEGTYRTDEYGTNDIKGIWSIDLATERIHPVLVSPYENNLRKMTDVGKIENGRIVLLSGRDIRYTGTLTGLDIVLYDMQTGRETLPAPPLDLSEHFHDRFNPFVNYPYIGWCDTWDVNHWVGPSSVINMETGEIWTDLSGSAGSTDINMEMRHIFNEPSQSFHISRLPDPGEVPAVDCDDNNECTDDRYRFDIDGCAHEANNNRCSKGICIEKECVSFPAPTIEDNEMVKITPIDGSDSFLMDIYELTNSKYAACVAAGVCRKPERNNSMLREKYYGNPEYDNYPVVYINRENAENYCIWQGKRLPTEEEFEADIFYSPNWNASPRVPIEGWDTAEVGTSEDVGELGLHDMNGNACEWVSGGYYPLFKPELFPHKIGVIRGGCHDLNADTRHPMTKWSLSVQVGFRCVRD